MLDIKYIRENIKIVKDSQLNRGQDPNVVDALLEVDKKRRAIQNELDELKAQKNQASKQIGEGGDKDQIIKQMQSVDKKAELLETQHKNASDQINKLLDSIPNIPGKNVPLGKDETGNVSIKKWGSIPKFDFEPLSHEVLGKRLDLIDTETSAKAVGSRFSYLKNELVMMHYGIMWLGMQLLTSEEKLKQVADFMGEKINSKPFVPILPPDMLRGEVYRQIGRLSHIEDDVYKVDDDLYLTGSAEHSMLPLHLDETIAAEKLPLRYVGFTTAFRKEAGTYGKDSKGILRQHQFDKLEMLSFNLPEDGEREHKFYIAIQEYLMQQLGLPYQVVAICTGDMGPTNISQFDIEAWLPSQKKYRETHTADYNGDYQARGMNTRFNGPENKGFVHTNDATVFSRRPLIAILENFQQSDGTIKVPEILIPYTGTDVIKPKQ